MHIDIVHGEFRKLHDRSFIPNTVKKIIATDRRI